MTRVGHHCTFHVRFGNRPTGTTDHLANVINLGVLEDAKLLQRADHLHVHNSRSSFFAESSAGVNSTHSRMVRHDG